jgi:mRNA-degrading endonuclease toxin of MazEF toxin-antitoxin module
VRRGQIWRFERDRPTREGDPRTPYRVIVSADYRIVPERHWVLTAPIVSALDIDTPVAVRLQEGDPTKGWIRADEITRTYVPWLSGPIGAVTADTLDALAAALRTEMDL